MEHVKRLEFSVLDFFVHLVSLVIQLNSYYLHYEGVCYQGSKFKHVSLVVQNFSLNLCALLSRKLSSADSISSPNNQSFSKMQSGSSNDLISYFNHSLVQGFWISSQLKFTIFVNISKSCQHVCARYSYLVEHYPTIVLLLIAEFWTHVPHFYSWECKMRLSISDWHQKGLDTELFIADVALRENNCMVCPET